MKAFLYILGGLFEAVGIVMLAAPDWNTYTRRLGALARRIFDRVLGFFRWVLRKPKHASVYADMATINLTTEFSASGIIGKGPGASLEEKVTFLLDRDQKTQGDMNDLRERVDAIERQSPEKLAALRAELVTHVESQFEAERADYRAGRALGAVFLAIGLGISTAGNLHS